MINRIATVAAIASLALITGCGGSEEAPIEPIVDDSEVPSSQTPTKNQLINLADPICAETNAAIANLGAAGTLEDSVLATQQAAILKGLASSLRGIGEPTEDAATLETYIGAVEEQARLYGQRATAAAEGDLEGVNATGAQIEASKLEASTAAEAYGFTSCGGEGTSLGGGETVTPTTPTTPAPTTPAPTPPAPAPSTGGGSSGGTSGGGTGGGSSGGGNTGGVGGG